MTCSSKSTWSICAGRATGRPRGPPTCERTLRLSLEHALARGSTLRSLGLASLAGFLLLLAAAVALALGVDGALARAFLLATGLTLVVGIAWIGAHLRLLRGEDDRPLPRINLANLLTLARLVAIPAFLVCALCGHPRLALLVFGVGAATDVADGLVARVGRQRTALGRVFDPVVDILFNVAVFGALYRKGILPGWVMALVGVRYGLLLLGGAAIYLFRGPLQIQPTILGKTTGVISTLLIVFVTAGTFGASGVGDARVSPLLVLVLGFVEGLTIPQVLFIGWLNIRRIGRPAVAPRLSIVRRERASG